MPRDVCGCGHPLSAHKPACVEWHRFPDVLDARQCKCTGFWTKPDPLPPALNRWP